MQITIVQSEIELAIKQYIHQQINVREGMDIEIELRATRGESGFQAVIDIAPATSKPEPALGIVDTVNKAKTSLTKPAAQSEAESTVPSNDTDPVAEVPFETAEESESEAPAEGNARKSLFGDMKRPVNG